jgi:hypothetical protein
MALKDLEHPSPISPYQRLRRVQRGSSRFDRPSALAAAVSPEPLCEKRARAMTLKRYTFWEERFDVAYRNKVFGDIFGSRRFAWTS